MTIQAGRVLPLALTSIDEVRRSGHVVARLEARIAELEARLAETEEENRRLRDEAGADVVTAVRAGATGKEAALLAAAMARAPRVLTREAAMTVLYGIGDAMPDTVDKVFDVMWCRIRAKALTPRGLTLFTLPGVGWVMPEATRDALRAAFGDATGERA